MKYKLLSPVLIILCCLFLAVPLLAQNELTDYQFQYEQYRRLYPQFTTARDKYLQFETLVAQEEAIGLTQQILIQRAQAMRTHFLLLRRNLSQAPEIVTEVRTSMGSSLDAEVEWLDDHMADLRALSTPTLGQLFEISDRFERKEKDYRSLSYEVLARILLGKVKQLQAEAVAINFLLDDYLSRQEGDDQTVIMLKNWLTESGNSIYQSQKSIENAEAVLEKVIKAKGDSKRTVSEFSNMQSELEAGRQHLLKIAGYQKEIIEEAVSR